MVFTINYTFNLEIGFFGSNFWICHVLLCHHGEMGWQIFSLGCVRLSFIVPCSRKKMNCSYFDILGHFLCQVQTRHLNCHPGFKECV